MDSPLLCVKSELGPKDTGPCKWLIVGWENQSSPLDTKMNIHKEITSKGNISFSKEHCP